MKIYLLVDDIEVNNYVLNHMIRSRNPASLCICCQSALKALEEYNKVIASGYEFDAIFIDYHMPCITGGDLTKYLRDLGCRSPIVIATADSTLEDVDGADGIILKPLNIEDIEGYLDE